MGQAPGTYIHCCIPCQLKAARYTPDTFVSLLWRTKGRWNTKLGNHRQGDDKCHQTSLTRVGIASYLRVKERWNATLYWLDKSQCRDSTRFLSITKDGRAHRLLRRRSDMFRFWCELELQANWSQRIIQSENCPYFKPRKLSTHTHSARLRKTTPPRLSLSWTLYCLQSMLHFALVYLDDIVDLSLTSCHSVGHTGLFLDLLEESSVTLRQTHMPFTRMRSNVLNTKPSHVDLKS